MGCDPYDLGDEVLKRDALGRERTPREALVEEFAQSEVSAKKFAVLGGRELPDFCLVGARAAQGACSGALGGGAGALVGDCGGRGCRRGSGWGGCAGLVDRTAGRETDVGGFSRPVADGGETGGLARPTHLRTLLSFAGALKVFVALEPVDLRKSFNGLEGLAGGRLGEDLRAGALLVFTNRRHSRLKILYGDGTGLWLLIKRLEKGTFSWPKVTDPQAVKLKLAPGALAMLTDGIDLCGARLRPWYERE